MTESVIPRMLLIALVDKFGTVLGASVSSDLRASIHPHCRYNGGEGFVPGAMFKKFDKRQATVYVKKVHR